MDSLSNIWLVTIFQPAGVVFHTVFPNWLSTLILTIVLGLLSWRMIRKLVKLMKAEKRMKEQM